MSSISKYLLSICFMASSGLRGRFCAETAGHGLGLRVRVSAETGPTLAFACPCCRPGMALETRTRREFYKESSVLTEPVVSQGRKAHVEIIYSPIKYVQNALGTQSREGLVLPWLIVEGFTDM